MLAYRIFDANMNTRSKTKHLQERVSSLNKADDNSDESSVIILRYENSIGFMKKDMLKKDILIEKLTEEQNGNIKEFEIMCKENISLKKKIAQYENSKAIECEELKILEKKLQECCKEKDDYEQQVIEGIMPWTRKYDALKDSYDALNLTYNHLYLDFIEKAMVKRKKQKRSLKRYYKNRKSNILRSKIKKLTDKCSVIALELKQLQENKACGKKILENLENATIIENSMETDTPNQFTESLLEQNTLLVNELEQRNRMIQDLYEENSKIIDIIYRYEEEKKRLTIQSKHWNL